jgi:hypothetical protein
MKLTQIKVGSILSVPLLSDLVSVLASFKLLGTTVWPTQVFDFEPSDDLVWVIPSDFDYSILDSITSFLGEDVGLPRDAVIVTRYDVVFSLAPRT